MKKIIFGILTTLTLQNVFCEIPSTKAQIREQLSDAILDFEVNKFSELYQQNKHLFHGWDKVMIRREVIWILNARETLIGKDGAQFSTALKVTKIITGLASMFTLALALNESNKTNYLIGAALLLQFALAQHFLSLSDEQIKKIYDKIENDKICKNLRDQELTQEEYNIAANLINKVSEINIKFLDFLISKGADINTIIKLNNHQESSGEIKICGALLHHAVNLELTDLVADLLRKYKADINLQDSQKRPVLFLALENSNPEKHNNSEIINIILEHNPDVNIVDQKNNSALKICIQKNLVNIFKKLTDKGARLAPQEKSSGGFFGPFSNFM